MIQPMPSDNVAYRRSSLFLSSYGAELERPSQGNVERLTQDEYNGASSAQKARYQALDKQLVEAFHAEHAARDKRSTSPWIAAGAVAAGLTIGAAAGGILKAAAVVSSFWPPFLVIAGAGLLFAGIWMLVKYLVHRGTVTDLNKAVADIDKHESAVRHPNLLAARKAPPQVTLVAPKRFSV